MNGHFMESKYNLIKMRNKELIEEYVHEEKRKRERETQAEREMKKLNEQFRHTQPRFIFVHYT